MQRPSWTINWFDALLAQAEFKVERIPFRDSLEWHFSQGVFLHHDERFFKIVGYAWGSADTQLLTQPLIEQKEIGVLGFILSRHENAPKLLVQAKIEPGNVGAVQLSPSCQATESNASRVHGGESPPYLDWFTGPHGLKIYDTLQSEQGTRFLGKQNRNVMVQIKESLTPLPTHRWLAVDEMLELLKYDHLVNTDARSVLICSPWGKLTHREPFTRYPGAWTQDLARSAVAPGKFITTANLMTAIEKVRSEARPGFPVPLEDMKGWLISEETIQPIDQKPFQVVQMKVKAIGREVPHWDQPIIQSYGKGRVTLVGGRMGGILHFLFQAQIEPGLYNAVELGPTLNVEPGEENHDAGIESLCQGRIMVEVEQSDEGGRFFQDITQYQIVDMGETCQVPENYWWLSLLQVKYLLARPGWLTNEARSALSLLLVWL
jgi:dTDP-4-dehydro-6-deoxy-alpha-D-glucopyranose 2,3-dehydratase